MKRLSAVAMATLLVFGLAACTPGSRIAEGTTVTVALEEAFTSYNPNTGHGSAVDTNASIVAATNSSFAAWGASGELVMDESFGSVEKVSDDPLTVRYTVADGVQWSDGVEVDAADLLLSWAANSRALNDDDLDPHEYVDPETGLFTEEFPDDAVYFDGFTANGLHHATQVPQLGDDGRSVTLVFDEHVADWAAIFTVGVPAHVVAGAALGIDAGDAEGARAAKDAVLAAIRDGDTEALAAISSAWNSDFVVDGTATDPALLVGSGPYTVSAVGDDGLTLTANTRYRGDHRPRYETIEVRYISDPLQAVAAFEEGEVDVIAPTPTSDVMDALDDVDPERVQVASDGVWDLLQVRFDRSANGDIEDERVREAFLRSVPRDELVDAAGLPGADARVRDSFTMMPGVDGYAESVEASDDLRLGQDAREAEGLLEEAADDEPALRDPTVCILFDPANPRRVAQFSAIRDAATSAGFTVTDCSSPDWRNLLGTPKAWDVALYGLRDRNLSAQAATAMFRSDSPLNHGHFESDEVDELLDAIEGEDDADARAALRGDLDALLWQQGWGLPLFQLPALTLTSPEVEGVKHSPYAATVLSDAWRWRPAAS